MNKIWSGALSMVEIYVWYTTSTGQEKSCGVESTESCITLDLLDMVSVDLLPLVWCSKLEDLSLRNNKLVEIDLSPLSKCQNLQGLRINNNQLEKLDLSPLADCPQLEELAFQNNRIKRVDISPLFHCQALKELKH
ncbi:MAG: leucine-rich repeat domain-containing protein, partial [Candidatus Thorarchaeota archaeon]